MSAAWSTQQQRILSTLGYSLYRPAVAAPAAQMDALVCALLRAAGLDPATIVDAEGWLRMQGVAPLPVLRSDPSAKRALWPHLRALRGGRARR